MSEQPQRRHTRPDMLEPVHARKDAGATGSWTVYLVVFLRIMAVVSLIKGLYHWAVVCGIGAPADGGFEVHTLAFQAATVLFAVLDLVAAVGLWLAAPWGAVVWLTSVVSMAVVEVFFPQVYGGSIFIAIAEMALLGVYLSLAIVAARERPA
jgi:uncharacterized membrane protein (DUF2068 family)